MFNFTKHGWINLYTLFSEQSFNLLNMYGRSGLIIQSGIATEKSSMDFYQYLNKNSSIVSLFDFENKLGLFPSVHKMMKFCLLTLSRQRNIKLTNYAFFLHKVDELREPDRIFNLDFNDINMLNPNTKTCMIFRSKYDAELVKHIYRNSVVLVNETEHSNNPWKVDVSQMFNISDVSKNLISVLDYEENGYILKKMSNLLLDKSVYVPFYESKYIFNFDHRFSSFENTNEYKVKNGQATLLSDEDKNNPDKLVIPRYWISGEKVEKYYKKRSIRNNWILAFRMISSPTNERTLISTIISSCGLSNSLNLIYGITSYKILLLLGNLNAISLDYVVRQRVGGMNVNVWNAKQFPVFPPDSYTEEDIAFIKPRVLELVYTAYNLKPFAEDMGYSGEPYKWDENRRANLKAELDAYHAILYGLNRKQLRYILDPVDLTSRELENILDDWEEVENPLIESEYKKRCEQSTFPGETFRVLKDKENRKFGEYRTRRLVLEKSEEMSGE